MTVNERIKKVIIDNGFNANSFSKAIGLSNNVTIGNIIGGRMNQPSFKVLELILQTFDSINPEWLLSGKGEPYKTFGANFNDKMVTQNGNPDGNPKAKNHQTNGAILSEPAVIYQSQQQIIEDQKVLIQNYKDIIDYMRSQEGIKEAEIKRLQNEVERLITQIEKTKDSGCDKVEECSQKRKAS